MPSIALRTTPFASSQLSIISSAVAAWSASLKPTTWTICGFSAIAVCIDAASCPLARFGDGDSDVSPERTILMTLKFTSVSDSTRSSFANIFARSIAEDMPLGVSNMN